MIPWLGPDDPFPPVERSLAHPSGLLAASRHIDARTLILAYSQGIFPWYAQDDPVLWWSPDPRMVLFTAEFVARRSLVRRIRAGLNAGRLEVRVDAYFGESMFSAAPDASKIALAALVQLLRLEKVPMLDCQQETSHLASLGARAIARADFCSHVAAAVRQPPIDWARYREQAVTDLLRAY